MIENAKMRHFGWILNKVFTNSFQHFLARANDWKFQSCFSFFEKKSLKCFRSDKTLFLNIPWGRRKTNYFAWVVLKMHHRHWPRINSQRRRGEAFFSDGRFLKFSLAPSEQIETLKKGHKLRLKRSDLIMLRNFNWVENGQTNEAIANQQQNFEFLRQKFAQNH